jgi:hypothetical protein
VIWMRAIATLRFAAGAPAGFVEGMNWNAERQADQRARNFFGPPPEKEKVHQELKSRW